ncbi:hypothetical protein V8F06_004048 [Rhypophila decipiens]
MSGQRDGCVIFDVSSRTTTVDIAKSTSRKIRSTLDTLGSAGRTEEKGGQETITSFATDQGCRVVISRCLATASFAIYVSVLGFFGRASIHSHHLPQPGTPGSLDISVNSDSNEATGNTPTRPWRFRNPS